MNGMHCILKLISTTQSTHGNLVQFSPVIESEPFEQSFYSSHFDRSSYAAKLDWSAEWFFSSRIFQIIFNETWSSYFFLVLWIETRWLPFKAAVHYSFCSAMQHTNWEMYNMSSLHPGWLNVNPQLLTPSLPGSLSGTWKMKLRLTDCWDFCFKNPDQKSALQYVSRWWTRNQYR